MTQAQRWVHHCFTAVSMMCWLLINRIPHCQNMSSKLMNVLDLTFVQVCSHLHWNFLRIPCTKNYHHYYYHFAYMWITFARFSRYSRYILQVCWTKLTIAYFQCLGYIPKITKSGSFLTQLLKLKMSPLFLEHGAIVSLINYHVFVLRVLQMYKCIVCLMNDFDSSQWWTNKSSGCERQSTTVGCCKRAFWSGVVC